MTEWKTTEPPVDQEIEYQRDNGQVETGIIEYAGQFGTGKSGTQPRMRQQFKRQGVLEMFEVRRWREIETE